ARRGEAPLPGAAARSRGAGPGGARHGRRSAGADARGGAAPGRRARLVCDRRRRPHRRALPRGAPGHPLPDGPPGSRGLRPAADRRTARPHSQLRAHGRPVRQYLEARAAGGPRAAGRGGDPHADRADGAPGDLAGGSVQAGVLPARRPARRGSRPPGRRDRPSQPRDLLARPPVGRRPRRARVGRDDDARRPLDRARRRQRGRHRRADRVRGHRPLPRVHRRLTSRGRVERRPL
ncbi:MAG: Phosphate transport system regulatory protein PhoU, partial [uncultured Solirubrobacterales bacterium]